MSREYFSSSSQYDRVNDTSDRYGSSSSEVTNEWARLRHQATSYAVGSGSRYNADTDYNRRAVSPVDPRRGNGRHSPVSPLNARRYSPPPYRGSSTRRRGARDDSYDPVAFAQASHGLDPQYFNLSRRTEPSYDRENAYNSSSARDGNQYGAYTSSRDAYASDSRRYAHPTGEQYSSGRYYASTSRYASMAQSPQLHCSLP